MKPDDAPKPVQPNLRTYPISTAGVLRDMLRSIPDWPLVIDGIDLPFGLVVDNDNKRIEFRKSAEQNAREEAAINAATAPAPFAAAADEAQAEMSAQEKPKRKAKA